MTTQRIAVFLTCLLSFTLFAQERISPPVAAPPLQIIPTERTEKPIQISRFHINTEVHGNLAETKIELTFHNPNNRVIAADFLFPLPDDGMITGYGLDVNGMMVDGVAVPKQKARVTYEKIVRQGIDPGLVEKVQGNVFKTRVFPLNAKQSRRIQLSYVTSLDALKNGQRFQVPLAANQTVSDFSLEIKVFNSSVKPDIKAPDIPGLMFKPWQNAHITSVQKNQLTLNHSIEVTLPDSGQQQVVMNEYNGQYHFALTPKLTNQIPMVKMAPIEQIQLVWDASHSRRFSDHEPAFMFLDQYFSRHPNMTVSLFILRNTLTAAGKYQVDQAHWKRLRQRLENIQYDGGTNLAAINALPDARNNQSILVFSDGLHTFDQKNSIRANQPLHLFSTDQANHLPWMQHIAEANGGQAHALASQSDFKSIINQMPIAPPRLRSIDIVSGRVTGLPQLPLTINPTRPTPITGLLLSEQAELRLNFGLGAKSDESFTIKLNQANALNSPLTMLIGARNKLDRLQIDSEANRHKIIQLAQEHGLVSDHTSLIVLESLEQYVTHQIAPPQSLPEMRNQYFVQIKNQRQAVSQNHTEKIKEVVDMWETRKAWWERDFPQLTKPLKKDTSSASRTEADLAAPEPPQMSVAAPVQEVTEDESHIVVTGSRIRQEDYSEMDAEMKRKASKPNSDPNPSVQISTWDPDTPYLKTLEQTKPEERLAMYYELKNQHVNSPAFYFDAGHFFFRNQQPQIGLQVLSNIAELKIRDSRLQRTLAMALQQHGLLDLSIQAFRQVLTDRPEEPQSHRDLGLALMARGDLNDQTKVGSASDYQEALTHLYQVITERWDRFEGIEVTTLMELNRLVNRAKLNTNDIDPQLLSLLDVDVRITSQWDSDMTDIDLWVIEPNGEKVTYSHTLSGSGGKFHQDFTGGYGPEEYLIKHAPKGQYTIKVHFYGNNSPELSGATSLYVNVYTNYGRDTEKHQKLTLRLEKANDDYLVGTIDF